MSASSTHSSADTGPTTGSLATPRRGGLEALRRLSEEGEEVAVILADQWMPEATGTELLARANEHHPLAKRCLLIDWGAWGDEPTAEAIHAAMSRSEIDYYVPKPWRLPDEFFHRTVAEFLHEWSRLGDATPKELVVVGRPQSVRAWELTDLLARNGVPHSFMPSDSPDGGRLLEEVGQAGFTSFSERTDPREVSEMLNAYFEVAIPPVVRRHGGDVDRIIGDALMVTFNRRGDQPDHAARAALAVQKTTGAVATEHPDWAALPRRGEHGRGARGYPRHGRRPDLYRGGRHDQPRRASRGTGARGRRRARPGDGCRAPRGADRVSGEHRGEGKGSAGRGPPVGGDGRPSRDADRPWGTDR